MSDKIFELYASIAAELVEEPGWHRYADWCLARGNRSREEAEIAAADFIQTALSWEFTERKRFGLWLMDYIGRLMDRPRGPNAAPQNAPQTRFHNRRTWGPGIFAPTVVIDDILRPTLLEWCKQEPSNPEVHFWLGLYGLTNLDDDTQMSSLREALHLDPNYGPARAAIAESLICGVEYNQHELPSGYIGDPEVDLSRLSEAEVLISESVDEYIKDLLREYITKFRHCALDWIRLYDEIRGLSRNERKIIWQGRDLRPENPAQNG